jgi:hypothetical protein
MSYFDEKLFFFLLWNPFLAGTYNCLKHRMKSDQKGVGDHVSIF